MTDRTVLKPWTRREFLYTTAATAGAFAGASLWRPAALLAATPRVGGTLKLSISTRPKTLNPLSQINNAGYLLGEMLYAGLTRIEKDMTPVPDIADAWKSNDDASEFVFTLRQGVRFHHGPEVTADDVVASTARSPTSSPRAARPCASRWTAPMPTCR
jgi:peptide/nickel transport system substrate-binding protein